MNETKFKVGDKVRINIQNFCPYNDNYYLTRINFDENYTIENIDDVGRIFLNEVRINFESDPIHRFWFNDSELELIEDEENVIGRIGLTTQMDESIEYLEKNGLSKSKIVSYIPHMINMLVGKTILKEFNNQEVTKMELKEISKVNVDIAKAKFDDEKNNAEVEEVKKQIKIAVDVLDVNDRRRRELDEMDKPHLETLKILNYKRKR